MIPVGVFRGSRVVVFGLGRSGLSAARALAAGGAEVAAWDDDPKARQAVRADRIAAQDVMACDWSGVAALVLSPGVPLTHPEPHPVARRARDAGVPVIGDLELFALARPAARCVGITGTNGKSTTTALLGHLLAVAGMEVRVGGNLGSPVLDLDPLERDGVYVLEVSSFQLDLVRSFRADVAVLLNLAPDHLDRHGGFANYVASKQRIFDLQAPQGAAVIGVDDPHAQGIFEGLARAGRRRLVSVAVGRRLSGGVSVVDGLVYDDIEGRSEPVADLRAVAGLPGQHNWQNAAAAVAAARALGVTGEAAGRALGSFPGLAHRLEPVATIGGVRFVNDSKATNATAAARALACYRNVYWIGGGRLKEGGIAPLEPYYPRIAHAFLIGEAATSLAQTLKGRVPVTLCGDLATAVGAAAAAAWSEGGADPVVLLSPACASLDQWASFEARGDAFHALVRALAERGGQGGAGREADEARGAA
ncbi:MAG: UDP-N-acetylmuramoyl-L-alanine--D-glutamate ligase [Alphaproteobacteria bacterium]